MGRWTLGLLGVVTFVGLVGCEKPTEQKARGAYLYNYCEQCHGGAGEGLLLVKAPPIAGMPQWYVESQLLKFRDGHRGAHADDTDGLKMRPMARTLQSEEDLKTVAAYVANLPANPPWPATLAGGDASKGKTYFATCVACHGADAGGNEAVKAPPIKNHPDWYMLAQLKKFKAGIRGTNPGDITGMQMRAMSTTLPDEQAMKDVIAHILTLR